MGCVSVKITGDQFACSKLGTNFGVLAGPGMIVNAKAGVYTFRLQSDDGSGD